MNYRRAKYWLLAVVCLVFCKPLNLCAQDRELKTESKEKVDAVLVLDASGSMLQTDPLRLRDEGAKLFVQFLKPGDRLGIVQFSGTGSVLRDLSDFEPSQVEEIAQLISKAEPTGEYTDILSGIKLAQDLLLRSPRNEASATIVLLSDGKMEPPASAGSAENVTTELLNNYLPELKAHEIRVHTLAFSDQADKHLLEQIALGTDALNWFTPTADKIHESFADLMLVVKKPQMLARTSKGFSIDSEIEEATFYANRVEDVNVTLVSPKGERFSATNHPADMKWYRGQKFDVITVPKPAVGQWQLEGIPDSEGFATVLTNLKLITDWPDSIFSGLPALLQARLYEDNRPVVLQEMSGVTQYAYQVIPTDKVSEPIIKDFLVDDGTHGDKIAGDGIFSAEILLEDAGEYKLRVVSRSPTFERRQTIPFRIKPRLVSLSVVAVESKELSRPVAVKDKDKEGDEAPKKKERNASNDYFRIELSNEATDLRKIKVTLIAIDEDNRRYLLPPVQSKDQSLRYERPVSDLPHDGSYTILASISGETKKGVPITGDSKSLEYERITSKLDKEEEAPVEVVVVKAPEKVEPPSPLFGIIFATLINLIGAGTCFFMLKKVTTGAVLEMPTLPSSDAALAAIGVLEAKAAETDIDINDPKWLTPPTNPAPQRTKSSGGGATANQEASASDTGESKEEPAAESTPEESAPAEEPPVEETKEEG